MTRLEENSIFKSIREGIIAIGVAYIYINLVIGITPLLLLLLPVPFIILGIRNNTYSSIAGMTVLTILLAGVENGSLAISFFIIFMPFIITVQYFIEEKESIFKTIIIGAVVILLSLFLMLFIESRITDITLVEELESSFNSVMNMQIEGLEELELTNSELLKIKETLKDSYEYILVVMPSTFLILSLIASYLNYKLSTFIVNNMGYREIKIPDFSLLKLPENILIGTATIIVTTFIIDWLELSYHSALVTNISLLIGTMFYIQGLSAFSYLLKRLKIGKFFRIILLFLNFIYMPMRLILIIVGFSDSIFDFRKIRNKAL